MKQPSVELIPLKNGIRKDHPTDLDVLLRVTSPQPEAKLGRPLMNLALVLDRSGSMGGEKLEYARQAAIFAVENLLPQDRLAVVIYDNQVEVLAPSAPVENRQALIERIRRVQAGGSTALHGGWLEGATQVARHLEKARLNRVILLTDGLANVGVQDPKTIATQVLGLAERGVSTTTLGVGLDYNEDLLVSMADAGQGNYFFIERPNDLPGIFSQELSGLSNTFGSTARLTLQEAPGVEAKLVNSLPTDNGGANVLPNLTGGIPLELLLRLKIPAGIAQPLSLRLSWETPGSGVRGAVEAGLVLPLVSEAEWERLAEDEAVAALSAKLEATRAREEAMAALSRGDVVGAYNSLAAAAPLTARYGELEAETKELHDLMREVGEDSNAARKRMSGQTYRNWKGNK